MLWILDGITPVEEPDVLKWAMWVSRANRTVGSTPLGNGVLVQTTFLGWGHSLLFETMVFGGKRPNEAWHYRTWEEAQAGHNEVVARLELQKKGVANGTNDHNSSGT